MNRFKDLSDRELRLCYEQSILWKENGNVSEQPLAGIIDAYKNDKANPITTAKFDLYNEISDRWYEKIKNEPDPYDPNFGDEKLCECGHPYYRHFDSYEDMEPIGCKYCGCRIFKLKENE